jgi:hypothetical protein
MSSWMMIGNFHKVMWSSELFSNQRCMAKQMLDFREVLSHCGPMILVSLDFHGLLITNRWVRGIYVFDWIARGGVTKLESMVSRS